MRKICSIVLTLVMTLAVTVPGYASEPAVPVQDEVQSEQPELPESDFEETAPATPPEDEPGEIPEPAPEVTPDPLPIPSEPEPGLEIPVDLPLETPVEPAVISENAEPDIQVTVPQVGKVIINPYNLEVEIGDETSTAQIAAETLTIENESAFPVLVQASAVGSIPEESQVVYVTAPPEKDAENKEVFLYVEFQNAGVPWEESYHGGDNQILITDTVSEPKEVLQLEAGPSQGVFHLAGTVSMYPEEEWVKEDGISVTVAFTFSPVTDAGQAQILDREDSFPAEIPVPEEVPVPEEIPIPEETPAPIESPIPEETPAPIESPIPEEPSVPVETPVPSEAPLPEESSVPEEVPAPEEGPVPGVTPVPEEETE